MDDVAASFVSLYRVQLAADPNGIYNLAIQKVSVVCRAYVAKMVNSLKIDDGKPVVDLAPYGVIITDAAEETLVHSCGLCPPNEFVTVSRTVPVCQRE